MNIALRDLGKTGTVALRDLWTGKDMDSASSRIMRTVPPHGAELFCVA